MITPRIEDRLFHYLTHKIIETPGAYLHAIGGIATHVHIGVSIEPNILVSDRIGKRPMNHYPAPDHALKGVANCRETRYGIADAFEATFATTASAEHVSATAETASKIRQMNVSVRTLDGIVKNRYSNNPGKLAAWISASHVEKAPKKIVTP